MEKYTNIERKIKSMTAKEIIMAMVDGLMNPVTKIDMYNFGSYEDGICYGCAATNAICRIGMLDPEEELQRMGGPKYRNYSDLISGFEDAIDELRNGHINSYNHFAQEYGFATIKTSTELPEIDNDNYQDPKVIQDYIDLANAQESEVKP